MESRVLCKAATLKMTNKNFAKFLFKSTKFGAENPLFAENYGGKVELLSPHILLCRKFASVCRKKILKETFLPRSPTY